MGENDTTRALATWGQASENVTDLFRKLAGPLAQEVGLALGDKAREYRLRNAVRILVRVRKMLDEAEITARELPSRLFLPAIESASVESDPSLQEKWASLLANAANPSGSTEVLPAFVEILKELTPPEVGFLDAAFVETSESEGRARDFMESKGVNLSADGIDIKMVVSDSRMGEVTPVMLDNLQRLRLLIHSPAATTLMVDGKVIASSEERYALSAFGRAFIGACRPPNSGRAASQ